MMALKADRLSYHRFFEASFVELVDGVACSLGITAQSTGSLVGVLTPTTCERELASAQYEGIRRAQACLQGLTLGIAQGTHEVGRFIPWKINLDYYLHREMH